METDSLSETFTNILADRLDKLINTPSDDPTREAYRLTTKGASLKSVLESVAKWGLGNIEGTEARLKPK